MEIEKIKMAALTENVRNKIRTEKRFYFALKPEQLKIIEYIVEKRDTFGVLPTDFAKKHVIAFLCSSFKASCI